MRFRGNLLRILSSGAQSNLPTVKWKFEGTDIERRRLYLKMLDIVIQQHVRNEQLDLIQSEEAPGARMFAESEPQERVVECSARLGLLFASRLFFTGFVTVAFAGREAVDDTAHRARLHESPGVKLPGFRVEVFVVVHGL